MFNFKKNLIIFTALFLVVFSLISPVKADLSTAFKGVNVDKVAKNMGYATGDSAANLDKIVSIAISAIFGLLGVIFVVYIVYGGVLWMTASGSEEKIKEAQTIVKRAIVGLFITLLSYSISVFVVSILVK